MTKKEAVRSALFIFIFLFLLQSFTYVVRTSGDVKERFAGFYAEKRNSLDVVMIGSSRVYNGYAPPLLFNETGIAMYMLSSNVQRPVSALYLTKEAIKTQRPELFVYDMQMFLKEDEALTTNMAFTRGVTDNLRYSLNRINTINAMVPDDDEEGRLSYYFDIFKYHTNWKTVVMPSQFIRFRYKAKSPLKGYAFEDTVGLNEAYDVSHVTKTSPMPAEQERYLRELCTFLNEEVPDIPALFIMTPGLSNEEETAVCNYMKGVVGEYGFDFLDMNLHYADIGLDFGADFKDSGNHLNALGASKVTSWFGNYLKDNYYLKDHRGDNAYSSWDKAYELWNEGFAEAEETILMHIENGEYYIADD